MLKRVKTQNWQSRGGKDYIIVGKDLLDKNDYKLNCDTLTLTEGKYIGKKIIVKYCIPNNLWIKSIDKNESAWYINP
jgi:hypothetical protein